MQCTFLALWSSGIVLQNSRTAVLVLKLNSERIFQLLLFDISGKNSTTKGLALKLNSHSAYTHKQCVCSVQQAGLEYRFGQEANAMTSVFRSSLTQVLCKQLLVPSISLELSCKRR